MSEIDGKGITQLLLNPLFLLNHILGTIVPGALLILLLGLKGNVLLRDGWLNPLFGYKTKVAIFLMIAYVIGSALRLPLTWIGALLKPLRPKVEPILKGQQPVVSKMFGAVISDGVLLANPALIDRLSHSQTNAAFHIGTGTALLVAACVPGDGSLRWIEALLGIGMFCAGILKARTYQDEAIGAVGIGFANILAGMTPNQFIVAGAVIKALGLEVKVSTEVAATTSEAATATSEAAAVATTIE